jgi:hypothetical protein
LAAFFLKELGRQNNNRAVKEVSGIFLNLRPAQPDPNAEVRQTKNVLEIAASEKTVTSIVV